MRISDWSSDVCSSDLQVLFDPNAALAQDIAASAPSRLLRWTDVSGQEFTGWFFPSRGKGDSPPPLFVTYYSCTGFLRGGVGDEWPLRSEEHTSELQSLMRISYAVFCLKKNTNNPTTPANSDILTS